MTIIPLGRFSNSAPGWGNTAVLRGVARLEELGGPTFRAKIWWIRGSLLGQGPLAIGGLALGSSKSPANHTDRHELAHAVLYQGNDPDTNPPTLSNSVGFCTSGIPRSEADEVE